MNVKSALLLALLAASSSLSAQTQPQSRIIAPVDDSRLVPLRGNVHPLAQARFDRGPASPSTPSGPLLLLLQRSSDQQQALAQYLADVQNPGSPSYHQWLTPAQYSTRFGISDADLQAVETWLQSHAFKIDHVSPARNVIQFSGNLGAVQEAFHTAIHTFQIHGATRFANVSDPQIPAALAPVVAGISPLNSFHPHPNFVAGPRGSWDTTTHRIKPNLTLEDSNSNFYLFVDPADAATIYDTPNRNLNPNYSGTTWDGTGVNIGIIGVSDLTLADVQNYREAFLGESSVSVNLPTQVVDGNDPGLVAGAAADEALLDSEIAGGIAPKAKIYYYTAADTDLSSGLLSAAFRAIDDNTVSILSASFGECESALGTSGNQLLLEAAQQAAAQGISFVVSAGDNGSAGCDDFDTQSVAQLGFAVNGFASTPYTVAVGGTDFDSVLSEFSTYVDTTSSGASPYYRTALSYIPENPWNDSTTTNTSLANNVPFTDSQGYGNIIAGSGGVSSVYSKPSWQNSLTPADNARDLPDVSLLAANGFYNAMWAFCGDSTSDGNTSTSAYTACQTSSGQFTASTLFQGAGGTSAAAPAFAGMLALVSQAQGGARLGQPNPVLYGLAAAKYATVFHDVKTGNNSVPCAIGSPNCGSNGFLTGYDAGTGYDLASGLGSVDVAKLVQNWSSVSLAPTTTTLNIAGSTASYTGVHGASLTFNVAVTGSGSTPTGNVAIIDTANETAGGTAAGPQNNGQVVIPLTSGSGAATYNGLPGGSYMVDARYGGDASNAASASSPISVNISPEPSTTVLQVNAYNPVTGVPVSGTTVPYGSVVLANARIEGTAEGANTQGLATGTVTFSNGSTTLGTAGVGSSNTASWPTLAGKLAIPAVGSYSYSATYSGDPSYNNSTSSAVPFTIAKAATSITANSPPTKVFGIYGSSGSTGVSFWIQTPYTLGSAPTGSMTVTINGQTVQALTGLTAFPTANSSVWLIVAYCAIPDSLFVSGNNAVTATYSGDSNYATSSQTITITDTDGIGSFTMTGSGDLAVNAGLPVQEQLSFTPSGGFYGFVYVTFSGIPSGVNTGSSGGFGIFSGANGLIELTGSTVVGLLNLYTPYNLAPGTYPITATAKDITGKVLQTVTFNLVVNPLPANAGIQLTSAGTLSFSANAQAGNAAKMTLTPVNGFIGALHITCTVTTTIPNPASTPTCNDLYENLTSSSAVPFQIPLTTSSRTTPGDYTLVVTATDIYDSIINATAQVPFTVTAYDGVFFSLDTTSLTVPAGATTGNTITMTFTPSGGYSGTIHTICYPAYAPQAAVNPAGCVVPDMVSVTGPDPLKEPLQVQSTLGTTPGVYAFHLNFWDEGTATYLWGTDFIVTVQPGPGLSLSKSADINIASGASTGNTSTITVSPVNGFTGTVNLSCSLTSAPAGAYDKPTCSVSPTVSIAGNTPATATLTVTTTAPTTASLERPLTRIVFGGGAVLAIMVFFGIPARRRAWRALFMLLVVMVMTSAMVACGGGGGGAVAGGGSGTGGGGQSIPGTTPGAYTITVKAADAATGNVTASTNVTLTVN